jgi:hypothetical protein
MRFSFPAPGTGGLKPIEGAGEIVLTRLLRHQKGEPKLICKGRPAGTAVVFGGRL